MWRTVVETGESHRVTRPGVVVRQASWGPASVVAFTTDRDGDEKTRTFLIKMGRSVEPVGHIELVGPHVRQVLPERPCWSRDGTTLFFSANDRSVENFDVLAYHLSTRKVRRLTEHPGTLEPTSLSPDGSLLLALDQVSNTHIGSAIIEVGPRRLHRPRALNVEGRTCYPVGWAGNSESFLLVENIRSDTTRLALYDLDSESLEPLSGIPEGVVEDAVPTPDGAILFSINLDGESFLFRRSSEGQIARIAMPPGVMRYLTMSLDGSRAATLWDTATAPMNVHTIDLRTGNVRQMTTNRPRRKEVTCEPPRVIRYESFDRMIPAFLYRNPDFYGPSPLVISIHGGPNLQERPGYNYGGFYQYLLSQGVAVLAPNIRGSTGYGLKYQRLLNGRWGLDDVCDIEAAVAWLRHQDWVDSNRVALFGTSYGGFLALSCLARSPGIYRLGAVVAAPTNLATLLEHAPPGWGAAVAESLGVVTRDQEMLFARSPMARVENITAPVFFVQGGRDPRVAPRDGDEFVARLRQSGGLVECIQLEDEGHGIFKPKNIQSVFIRLAHFLLKHL